MVVTICLLLFIFLVTLFIINLAQFGQKPNRKRLRLVKNSPNYKNGAFQNLNYTPSFSEGYNFFSVMYEFIFKIGNRLAPEQEIPYVFTDLKLLNKSEDVLVWFGHSSYFMQIDGLVFLIDPVFSGFASPFPFMIKAFEGSNNYKPEHIPDIDYLIITHDHWDHLDYQTLQELKPKIKNIITGLGTGQHFEKWKFDINIITELDWYEEHKVNENLSLTSTPARHFSGRGLARNKAIWSSFVLKTSKLKIFIGGDSGYDSHFKKIGSTYGPFDLSILENGQYDRKWKYIHTLPHEVAKAAKDLNSKQLLAVHSSKFKLANHPWDEPLSKLYEYCLAENQAFITPIIGEKVSLGNQNQKFTKWWESLN